MDNAAGRLIVRENTVLAIIDMQERLLPVIYNKEKILNNTLKLVRFAKIIGLPVLVSEQEKLGATVPEIKAELPDMLPANKIEFDACRCTGFREQLNKLGKKSAILVGIESHICITQTTLSLLPQYSVHVVSDAVSSRSQDDWNIALQRMRQAGAVITSTEMVIYELLQKAGTEEFKAALKLVK